MATQLQQQQQQERPIKLVQHCTVIYPTVGGLKVYTTAIDADGTLWERWNDGGWHQAGNPVR